MEISSSICLFVASITIAGLCNYFYRTTMLKDKKIAIINNRSSNRLQSMQAIFWIDWLSSQDSIEIIPEDNSGVEKKVGKYFVDGYCHTNVTIYEFYGCFYQGCERCFNRNLQHPFRGVKM